MDPCRFLGRNLNGAGVEVISGEVQLKKKKKKQPNKEP